MTAVRRDILFTGRVQGVGFRATVLHCAAELPLAGTVQNLPDGRVELILEGDSFQIDLLVERLREHFGSFLRTIQQHSAPATGHFDPGIRVLY